MLRNMIDVKLLVELVAIKYFQLDFCSILDYLQV